MTIQEQINDAEFPIVVTASAGTGKTYSIVNKVQDCLKKGVNPLNMLVFTFTVDAANELKNRIENGSTMTIGTIHSVMYQIVRENSTRRYFVLDNGKQMKFVMGIFKDMKIDFDYLHRYINSVGFAKNKFADYYEILNEAPEMLSRFFGDDSRLVEFAKEYEARKEHCHKIDFDDMTLKALGILRSRPDVLDNRQERWKYIFVDEAQDLCPPQTEIIKLLASKYKNLFIVGDEKQAIYASFRASSPQFLREFRVIYPEANEFVLPATYRCAKSICRAGNKIAGYIDRSNIDTIVDNNGSIDINMNYPSQHDEAKEVCKLAINDFNDNKSVRILYRTNAQSLVYQQLLIDMNIPFSVSQATSIFFTKEVRLATACCSFKYEYDDLNYNGKAALIKSLRPIITNKFGLYDIAKLMTELQACPFENIELFISGKTSKTLDELNFYYNLFRKAESISDIFYRLSGIVYKMPYVFSQVAEDNLIGISEFAINCKDMENYNALVCKIQRPKLLQKGERAISLSTIHGAKGLEADSVFLTGVCDGLLPHKSGLSEEELNLFYVGVTRAKQSLYVTGFDTFGNNKYEGHSYSMMIKGV
jgi:DNA helicase II / ATP-dependent DNA helicase PcrA